VSLAAAYPSCPSCFTDWQKVTVLIPVNFFVWIVLWKGNGYTVDVVDHFYSWIESPFKRLVSGILAHTIYTTIAVFFIYYFLRYVFDIRFGSIEDTLPIAIIITFTISLVLHSNEFLQSWRRSAVEKERVQKDVVTARYESLKNQVNPHFLFNSLNTLDNLVHEDAAQASKFIRKLSDVYRYVLESRDKDLVDLGTELKFADSYLFLQKIRFGDSFHFTMNVPDAQRYRIPPLSVQMLLENAIKHNVVSRDHPLTISMIIHDGMLVVENTLQPKKVLKGEGTEVGLANISARFAFFTKKEISIEKGDGRFTVTLPLIER
jgi:sensor histidine kinase YesM